MNENHDPHNGEFSSGGGSGSDSHAEQASFHRDQEASHIETAAAGGQWVKDDFAGKMDTVMVHASIDKMDKASENTSNGLNANYQRSSLSEVKARYGDRKVAPTVNVKKDGSLIVQDGNHRLAMWKAAGVKSVMVSVPRANAERARKFIGA